MRNRRPLRHQNAQLLRSRAGALVVLLGLCATLAGCSLHGGRTLAQELVQGRGFEPVVFRANGFTLRGFLRPPPVGAATLTVYIEGDGRAYDDRSTPSPDPTPDNPMALRLAVADPAPGVLYLGRPCQYTQGEPCSVLYWTVDRYAPVVVNAMDKALDQARRRTGAERLHLVGYSGGGAIAALLAARRSDVAGLATVAGNLDHAFWTELHEVSPLRGSLNPADDAARLRRLPQVHFVGRQDTIMPPAVAESYMARLRDAGEGPAAARLVPVQGVDHACCWPGLWPRLLREWGAQWRR